jgi:hypothetical protein
MKKLIVLLLAFAMVGVVFAEDAAPVVPKVSGYFYAGANVLDVTGVGTASEAWNQSLAPSWVSSGNYATVGLSYSVKEFGFSGTVEYENNAINTAFRDYTAWVKPFGDVLKLSAGKVRNGDYRLTSYIDGSGFNTRIANAEYGLLAQVYPVKGLSLGVFNWIDSTGAVPLASWQNLNFGASYTVAGIGKFVAAAKRNITIVDATAVTTVNTDEYFVGFDLSAVKGLTAKVGGTFDLTPNVLVAGGGAANNKWTKVWATAGYTVSSFDLGVDAYYLKNSGTELYAKGQVAYKGLAAFTPSVYGYATNVKGYVPNTLKADGVTATTDNKRDGTNFGFGAQVAIPSGAATLYIGLDWAKTVATIAAKQGVAWSLPVCIELSF